MSAEQYDTLRRQGEAILALLRVPGLGGAGWPEALNGKLDAVNDVAQETYQRVRGDNPTGDVLQLLTAAVASLSEQVTALAARLDDAERKPVTDSGPIAPAPRP